MTMINLLARLAAAVAWSLHRLRLGWWHTRLHYNVSRQARAQAALRVGDLGDRRSRPHLSRAAVNDPDPGVRGAAIGALARLRARKELEELARTDDPLLKAEAQVALRAMLSDKAAGKKKSPG